jgi:hypothetical protein
VSISNIIALEYEDGEDQATHDVKFDIGDIAPPPAALSADIEVGDGVFVKLHYPKADLYGDSTIGEDFDKIVIKCVDKVYNKNEVFTFSPEELVPWMEKLPIPVHDEIRKFFGTVPQVTHTVSYTNGKGTVRTIVLRGLDDFFALR